MTLPMKVISKLTQAQLQELAPCGHYIALRIGFAFPKEEVNALPDAWVKLYTEERLVLADPVLRWAYRVGGAIRWSDPAFSQYAEFFEKAARFGLRYGASFTSSDKGKGGQISVAHFVREDRDFTEEEMVLLRGHLEALHRESAPPTNLTEAEIETLSLVKEGMRLKQAAHVLGISEGAVKLRLRNAKAKLGAATSTQAATMASAHGLI